MTQRAREHDVGILRMDQDAGDAAGSLEAASRPRPAGIGGLEHPFADRDVTADATLAGAGPHRAGIRRRHGDVADRLHGLSIEDVLPRDPAIGRLGDAS
jgi:hypothetical protein